MSRRCHHGSPRHARTAGRERRRGPLTAERPGGSSTPSATRSSADAPVAGEPAPPQAATSEPTRRRTRVDGTPATGATGEGLEAAEEDTRPRVVSRPRTASRTSDTATPDATAGAIPAAARALPAGPSERGATAPQLRRFIKSRAYVPVHELRRRFGLNGADDEVTAVEVDQRRVYVGLPPREGELLGELLKGGDVGAELSLDPIAPIVIGVYPIRPIPRS